jgi:hypothetical protein
MYNKFVLYTLSIVFIFVQNGKSLILNFRQQNKECGVRSFNVNEYDNYNNMHRIINAQNAGNSWPWMVSIRRIYNNGSLSTHLCGGVLIYDNYILTAAHCINKFSSKQIGEKF